MTSNFSLLSRAAALSAVLGLAALPALAQGMPSPAPATPAPNASVQSGAQGDAAVKPATKADAHHKAATASKAAKPGKDKKRVQVAQHHPKTLPAGAVKANASAKDAGTANTEGAVKSEATKP